MALIASGTGRGPLEDMPSPMVDRQTIQRRMAHVQELSTIPATIKKILEVLDNPQLSLNEIASVVSKDQVLAAHLLKTANSAYFGFGGRVRSIVQALLLLGLRVAKALLLGAFVFRFARGMEGLWAHSVGTAILAGMIGHRQALEDERHLFVAGLLHDIGKVFLTLKFPEEFRGALALAHTKGTLIVHAEEDVFQMNHAEVAGWVLERWHLPGRLIEPIRYHHEPALAVKQPTETAVIHLSDILTRARGFGSAGDPLVPLIDKSAWARLDLSTEELLAILSESDQVLREAEGFLSSL